MLPPATMEVLSLSSQFTQPSRMPDLRAIIDERGVLVVPWRSSLRWAELNARPVDGSKRACFPGPGPVRSVFELWRTQDACLAR